MIHATQWAEEHGCSFNEPGFPFYQEACRTFCNYVLYIMKFPSEHPTSCTCVCIQARHHKFNVLQYLLASCNYYLLFMFSPLFPWLLNGCPISPYFSISQTRVSQHSGNVGALQRQMLGFLHPWEAAADWLECRETPEPLHSNGILGNRLPLSLYTEHLKFSLRVW